MGEDKKKAVESNSTAAVTTETSIKMDESQQTGGGESPDPVAHPTCRSSSNFYSLLKWKLRDGGFFSNSGKVNHGPAVQVLRRSSDLQGFHLGAFHHKLSSLK